MPGEFHNILVIKIKRLGDVVITTPVFASLRRCFPGARITAVVNEGTDAVLDGNPDVDRVIALGRLRGPLRDMMHQIRFLREIRRQRFDLAIELTGGDRAAFTAFSSGAPRRLGFASKRAKKFDRHLLYTDLVRSDGAVHIMDDQLRMVAHLGCIPAAAAPAVFWSADESGACRAILDAQGVPPGAPYAVIHPAPPARYKEWKIEETAALCRHLNDRWNVRPVLVGGTAEGERRFIERAADLSEGATVNLAGRLSLRHLVALLGGAELFVGVDSGPMHIAAAAGTPLVALFGPSNAHRWGPVGKQCIVLQQSWDCVPCRNMGCTGDGVWSRCLQELSLDEVAAAVDLQMKRRRDEGAARKPS